MYATKMLRTLRGALAATLLSVAPAVAQDTCDINPTAPGCPPVNACERERADICAATRLAAEACDYAVHAFVCRQWYTQGDYTYCLSGEVNGRIFTVAVFLGVR